MMVYEWSASVCFRPLAGITVFRTRAVGKGLLYLLSVSVPWRGLRSFGLTRRLDYPAIGVMFPSPGGDYGLSDPVHPSDEVFYASEFPSPGGDYGLSDWCWRQLSSATSSSVSVPWRGLRSFGLGVVQAG